MRLEKLLAEAGFGSRRKCTELVLANKVEVDGIYTNAPGMDINPDKNKVYCDGMPAKIEKKVYFILNKPKGYICTNSDELGRSRVTDLFVNISQRLYTVGRLDADSEGLLIVTNDGNLANKLAHPRYEIQKTYLVEVNKKLTKETLQLLKKGVWLSDGKLAPVKIRNVRSSNKQSSFEMILNEGRNREIRRMLAKYGHKVRLLRRISMGPIRLDPNLKVGKYKMIPKETIYKLLKLD